MEYPFAYLLERPDKKVINNLKSHGIEVKRLNDSITLGVKEFRFESITPSNRLNQGHYTNQIEGGFVDINKHFEKGTVIVLTNQKLGRLVPALLEPEAQDGLLKWNFFDKYLAPQWGGGYYPYPVYKLTNKTDLQLIEY